MDLVGPLLRSRGNHTFLVVKQDIFSKLVEMASIGAATVQNVLNKLRTVLSTSFATTAPSLCLASSSPGKLVGVAYPAHFTYSPQANPVERSNRLIKAMTVVKENHSALDQFIGEIRFAINTARHETTGFTPAMFCFGRELKAPRAIYGSTFETTEDQSGSNLAEVYTTG